jgi:hypothetical protein
MKWLRRVRTIDLTLRQSAILGGVSFVLLLVFSLFWLSMLTRTAVLNAQIDELDARRLDIEDQANLRWRQLGELSNPVVMADRADKLGFAPVKVEYLVIESIALGNSSTLTVTAR